MKLKREDTLRIGDTVYSLDDLIDNLNECCGTGEFDLELLQTCRGIFESIRRLAYNDESMSVVVGNHVRAFG